MAISIKVGSDMFLCGRKADSGAVLVVVLIALIAFTLYGIHGFDIALLEMKMSRHHWQAMKRSYVAENMLKHTERQLLLNKPVCFVPWSLKNNYFSSDLPNWSEGCRSSLQYFTSRIAVERMPRQTCTVMIAHRMGEILLMEPNWYRVTVLLQDKKAMNVLQSVVAVPGQRACDCKQDPHIIEVGRQSWHRYTF